MKLEKMAQIAIGLYLIPPMPEDALSGGLTVAPSALLGIALVADGFGVKLW